MKRNLPIIGLVIGIILPMLAGVATYFIKFSAYSFDGYLRQLSTGGKIGPAVLSLCVLTNIIPFLYFSSKKLDYTARGVLVATMLYFVLFILIKYVWV